VTISGCTSNVLAGAYTLSDPSSPTIALGTTNSPSTCGGTEGSIELTGLAATTTYTVNYTKSGAQSTSKTTDGSGNLVIDGLSAGSYTNIKVITAASCSSNTLAGPVVLSDPTAPTIAHGSDVNPSTCSGTNGSISLTGLANSTSYTVNYKKNTVSATPATISSNGSGTLVIGTLGAGSYTDISVTISGCTSNVLAGAYTLSDPSSPVVTFITQPGSSACTNALVTYTTQTGQSSYVWNVPGTLNTDYAISSGGISETDHTVTLKWLTTGSKTVAINYTNASGCMALSATSSTATAVSACNTPPDITSNGGGATASISAAENTTSVTTVTATDSDLPAQTLTYSITGGIDSGKFTIDGSTGVLTFVTAPNYEAPTDNNADNIYEIQVTVTDNGAGNLTDVQAISVSVMDANEPPVITSDGGGPTAALSRAEGTTAVTTVVATDVDRPAQTLTFTKTGGADAARFVINSSTGELTFVTAPNYEAPTDSDLNNSYEVQITVTDSGLGNLTDMQLITVTISNVNEPPVVSDFTKTGPEDNDILFAATNFTSKFSDVDGDSMTRIKIISLPANGTLKLSGVAIAAGQEITLANLANITFTPDANWNGLTIFEWNGFDGTSYANVDEQINIFITTGNDAPTVADLLKSGPEDTDITFAATDFTSRFTDLDGNPMTKMKVVSLPSNGTLELSGVPVTAGYEIATASLANLTFTPSANWNGSTDFLWNGFDGTAYAVTAEHVTITIAPVNDPPIVSNVPKSGLEDTDISFASSDFINKFADVDGDAMIKIKVVTLPANGSLKLSGVPVTVGSEIAATNLSNLTFTPDANWNGSTSFDWNGFDGTVYAIPDAQVNITLTNVNEKPTVADVPKSGTEDNDVLFTATDFTSRFADSESSPLTKIRVVSLPSNGILRLSGALIVAGDEISAANLANITFSPLANWNGSTSFDWNGSDGTDYAVTAEQVNLTIAPVNDPPVAVNDVATVNEGGTLNGVSLLGNDSDPDGNTLTIYTTPISGPSHGTLVINTDGTYSYTPDANYSGTDIFTYRVCDNAVPSLCSTATVTITVTPVNSPPIAVNDAATIGEEGTLTGSRLLSNDSDPEGDILTINTTPVSGPSHGILVINANGTYTYTPGANYNGIDSFVYQVCDDAVPSKCASATVTITITPVNDQPVAVNDVATIAEDAVLTGTSLLGNDSDPDGNTLTVDTTPVSGPTHGVLVINSNGTYIYTPTANYNGTDSFTYRVCDNGTPSLCSTATVSITVTPVNDPPVAANDVATIGEGGILSGTNLLGNDSDPDGNLLSIDTTPVSGPTHGTLVINSDGTYTYTPDVDYIGTDSFTYKVCDNGVPSLCASATVTITVTFVNHSPVAVNDVATVSQNITLTGSNLLTNDSDPDGDLLTINTTPVSGPAHGTLVINPDGTYSYTPAQGYVGTDSFIYRVCDNGTTPLCAEATVSINVTACNSLAMMTGFVFNGSLPLANVPVALVPQGTTPGTIQMRITGTDGFYQFDNVIAGDYMVQVLDANLNSARNLFNVNSSLFFTTLSNCKQTDHNFIYGAATSPVLGDFVWFDVNDNKIQDEWYDANNDNKVTKNVADASGFIDFNKWEWIDLNGDGSWTGAENEGELNKGGFGNAASANVKLTGPNGYTSNIIIGITGYWRGRPANYGNYTAELIVDQPYLDAARNIASSGLCKPLSSALKMATLNTLALADNIPNQNYDCHTSIGTVQGEVTTVNPVNLELDLAFYCTLHITPPPANNAPLATNDAATIGEGGTLSGSNLLGNDTDPEGGILTINTTPVSGPDHGTLVINPNGTYSYTPAANYSGTDSFTYQVCDNGVPSLCATAQVTITVTAVNDVPVADTQSVTTPEDTPLNGTVIATDPDGDPLTFSKASDPQHGTVIVNSDGTYTYSPALNYNGPDSFTVTVSDGKGGTVTVTVNITVTPVNDGPVVQASSYSTPGDTPASIVYILSTLEDTPYNGVVKATDAEGDLLTFSSVGKPLHGSMTVGVDGSYSYQPEANYFGLDNFTVQLSDGNGGIFTVNVKVTVVPVNDAPSFNNLGNISVCSSGGEQQVSSWATPLAGPANESAQTLQFTVTNTNNALFSVQPAVDASGTLRYFLAANQTGSASVTVQLTDDGGTLNGGINVSGLQTFTILVNASPAEPVVDVSQLFCGQATVADLKATVPTGNSIKWYTTSSGGAALPSSTILTDATLYYAETVSNATGCKSLVRTLTITGVHDNSVAPSGNPLQTFCNTESAKVSDLVVSGLNVKWYNAISGGTEIPATTLLVNGAKYYATQTTNGCESITRFGITVSIVVCNVTDIHPPVVADFTKVTDQNQSFTFDQSDYTSKYKDLDNDPMDRIRIESLPLNGKLVLSGDDVFVGLEILLVDLGKILFVPDQDYTGETSFTWTASDSNGYALAPATVTITVNPLTVYIPEGFSPNGDGINDYFVIKGADRYVVTLRIFNRWGNKVYESEHYKNDWDGASNIGFLITNQLPGGTYYYTANFNNGDKEQVGYLTLIR